MRAGPVICPVTDLPRITCACEECADYRPTKAELETFALTNEPDLPSAPVWVRRLHYRSTEWTEAEPRRVVCDHGKPCGMTICTECAELFARILRDVPAVVTELELHLTKQTGFLERGAPQQADPDEASIPWNEAASKATRRLFAALGGRPVRRAAELLDDWDKTLRREDLELLVSRVTAAVAAAHRVVDSPPATQFYGYCPTCGAEIYQERVSAEGTVDCPACGYSAPREQHLQRQLTAMRDKEMRLGTVVRVLNDAGVPTSRQEIENLIYHQGLAREWVQVPPHWVGTGAERRLVAGEGVWMYTLGHVIEALAKKPRYRHLSDKPEEP